MSSPNVNSQRASRELYLAAFGVQVGSLDGWVIDRLTSAIEDAHVRAGQVIFAAGDPSEYVYFMNQGEVRLTAPGMPSWTYRGRWLLGTAEALLDIPYPRSTTAVVDFEAMRARRSAWVDLLEDSVQLSRRSVYRMSFAVARLEDRIPSMPPPTPGGPAWTSHIPHGPLGTMDRLALLADVRMLRGPGVQVLADLAEISEELWFEAGELVSARGVERKSLLIVVDGLVRAAREGPDVERHYGPGDLICGVFSFGPQALPWEAVALSKTRTIALPLGAWFDLMEEHFDLVRSTLGAMHRRREVLLEQLAAAEGGVLLT